MSEDASLGYSVMKMLRDGLRPEVTSDLYTAVLLAKFRKNAHNLAREIGNAGMIIEFDSIRTAYELLGSSVRYTRSSAVWTFSSTAFVAQW